jgi:class 3 adenylate cyclase
MLGEPVHRTILAIDVEGFTRRPRRDVDRLRMRKELYRLLEQALARADLRREDFRAEDRGDGVLVLLNAEVPRPGCDAYGHASKDLNLTFRLLDSDLLRG